MQFEKREVVPVGMHTGVLYQVCDLGTQKNEYEEPGKPIEVKYARQVRLNFELSDCLMADGRPFAIGRNYNIKLGDKSRLVIDMKSWQGLTLNDSYNLSELLTSLLGKGANINVTHTEKGNAKIANISPLKKGEVTPALVNPPVLFDLDEFDGKDFSVFNLLPPFIQKMIQSSPEYLEKTDQGKPAGNQADPPQGHPALGSDEVPF